MGTWLKKQGKRRCYSCKSIFELNSEFFFHDKRKGKGGFDYQCKKCHYLKNRAYKKTASARANRRVGKMSAFTYLRKQIRDLRQYRQWRCDVFERDNYTCQFCHIRGLKIEADHIKSFSLILYENNITTLEQAIECQELWNINNGRTLCKPCHKTTKSWSRRIT